MGHWGLDHNPSLHYRKHLNFRGPKTHENKRKPTKIHYFRRQTDENSRRKISSTKIGNYLRRYRRKWFIFVGFPKADDNSWSADYFRRPRWSTKIGAWFSSAPVVADENSWAVFSSACNEADENSWYPPKQNFVHLSINSKRHNSQYHNSHIQIHKQNTQFTKHIHNLP
jgi:hypothetical protein